MQRTNSQFTLSRFLDKHAFISSFLSENEKFVLLKILSFKNQTGNIFKNLGILLKIWLIAWCNVILHIFLPENVKDTYSYLCKVNQYRILFLFVKAAQQTDERLL